ncbi:testis-expressed protein 9-like isoform X2 [Leptidea sinapis]|uniref:testis-expressed protein 9-like isoform X1 n=1 Tax=Leptidea sinapis TaxID=189913 RepID=UPI0021C27BE7|nr:testis-expressed protein 9-like isoform X1 [Leptidea sinapis]XP_050669267.1 testis-expressed protein 9-like isoform X2 [Leptidea sinapis]
MESADLLARENEFKKLNKQLEKKTETLMKEIEEVMQKPDIFSDFTRNLSGTPVHVNTRRHSCDTPKLTEKNFKPAAKAKKAVEVEKAESADDTGLQKCSRNVCDWCSIRSNKNDDYEFLCAFVSVSVKDNVLPKSFLKDKITTEKVCKFLAARVKLMQEQIDKLQSTIDKMAKSCDNHMSHFTDLETERLSLINKANSLKSETSDVKAKYAVLQNKLNEKERMYKEQRSTTDRLTNELKIVKSRNVSVEARCAAQDETIATLKQQLESAKTSEKEFRDATRNLSTSHETAICRLECKVKNLNKRIEKQTALIDNLKRQNALLATDAAMKMIDIKYSDFLNSDF